MYICIYVYMYICIYVYMYICIYVYMYICIYMSFYTVYVYIVLCIVCYVLDLTYYKGQLIQRRSFGYDGCGREVSPLLGHVSHVWRSQGRPGKAPGAVGTRAEGSWVGRPCLKPYEPGSKQSPTYSP